MLIDQGELIRFLNKKDIKITGVFHVGAHECEELAFYTKLGVPKSDIVWVDALQTKVEEAGKRGIPNVYTAVVTDKDDDTITFNIANNNQSSSVLPFGTHATEHPHVVFVDKVNMKTVTIDTFFRRNKLDSSNLNFWNFDIQGAELMALKGAVQSLQYADVLYLEVNQKELYKGCGLLDELDSFLETHKFKRYITKITQHGWGDAVYIREV